MKAQTRSISRGPKTPIGARLSGVLSSKKGNRMGKTAATTGEDLERFER
jgi:hypothetical protein